MITATPTTTRTTARTDIDHAGPSRPGATARRGLRRAAPLIAAAGGAALGLSALTAAPAWAHDELLSATPEAGAVLTESPEEITLEFTGDGLTEGENITNEIQVTDESGEGWETDTVVDGATLSTALENELPDGEYEVVYRVVYSDGHDEEDSYSFEVELPEQDADQGSGETEATAEEEDGDVEAAEAQSADADAGVEGDSDAAESDLATAEGQFPAWAAVLFSLGGVLVVILGVVLMRRKMTQVEEWKQAPRQPRDTTGRSGSGTDESGTDESGTDQSGTDRPRDEE